MKHKIISGRVWIEDEEGNTFDYCEAIQVVRVLVDLLAGKMDVEVEVQATTGPNLVRMPRSDIDRKIIPRLTAYGLTMADTLDDALQIQEILLDSIANASVEYYHDRLGFCEVDRNLIFLADRPIGLTNELKADSRYIEPQKTAPNGTLESWKRIIANEVVGHSNLELALAVGVTAPVAYILKEARAIANIPIWAFVGRSSTGKTTALKLVASIFGSPEESVGMISDFNTTQNAFFASLEGNQGVPMIVDEATCQVGVDSTTIIYSVPKGQSKRRCKSDGTLQVPKQFSGALLLSSERSILENTTKNQGMYARIVEFTLPWTDSALHASRLEEGCRKNYGSAVYPLIEWLLHRKDILPNYFKKELEIFRRIQPAKNGVEDRLLKMYAILTLSARVMKLALKLSIDVTMVRKLLLANAKEHLPQLDKAQDVYDSLLDSVVSNGSMFPTLSKKELKNPLSKNLWGKQDFYKSKPCVWISQEHFSDFMKKANSSADDKDILREMHQRGMIGYFSDRFCVRQNLGKAKVPCYCVFLKDSADIFTKLNDVEKNAKGRELASVFLGGDVEANLLQGQSEVVGMADELKRAKDCRMAFGFTNPAPQSEAILLNRTLCKALQLKNTVFLTPIPDAKKILLTAESLGSSSIKAGIYGCGTYKRCQNLAIYRGLMKLLDINLPTGSAIAYYAIEVGEISGKKIAVVDLENGIISVEETIKMASPYELPNPFAEHTQTNNRQNLLAEDDNEE